MNTYIKTEALDSKNNTISLLFDKLDAAESRIANRDHCIRSIVMELNSSHHFSLRLSRIRVHIEELLTKHEHESPNPIR